MAIRGTTCAFWILVGGSVTYFVAFYHVEAAEYVVVIFTHVVMVYGRSRINGIADPIVLSIWQ